MKTIIWRAAVILLSGVNGLWGATNYVDINVVGGTGSGDSWVNAATNLRAIIGASQSNDQIWVAQGTYYPTNGTDRGASFRLRGFTALYGGFTNGMGSLAERNWTNYATILSGNIGDPATNADNCSNVVIAASNTVVDGFCIAHGYSGTNSTAYGAGMYISSAGDYAAKNVMVANCSFVSNVAVNATNQGWGGGLYMYGQNSNTVVTNCSFIGNSAGYSGGGLVLHDCSTVMKVLGCTFRDNQSTGYGGGGMSIWANGAAAAVVLSNCVFSGNQHINAAGTGAGGGGLLCRSACYPAIISDCVFVSNYVSTSSEMGGGGIAAQYVSINNAFAVNVNNCVISGNSAGRGGGILCHSSVMTVSNSIIAGNFASGMGGGAYVICLAGWAATGTFANCAFIGNYSTSGGGLRVYLFPAVAVLKNCTFTGNRGVSDGGGISAYNAARTMMTNCIMWDDMPYEWYSINSTSSIAYSDIAGGIAGITSVNSVVADNGGNLNLDPVFAPVVTGRWTASGLYNADAFKTILVDTNAVWTADEHVGKTVVVNTNYYYQYYVTANTATNLTVWGNVAAMGTNTASYRIVDIHVQSRAGRWTPLGWVVDATNSPCIDAGDLNSVYALEPVPNGRRINQGRYGNTLQASLTHLPAGVIFQIH